MNEKQEKTPGLEIRDDNDEDDFDDDGGNPFGSMMMMFFYASELDNMDRDDDDAPTALNKKDADAHSQFMLQ